MVSVKCRLLASLNLVLSCALPWLCVCGSDICFTVFQHHFLREWEADTGDSHSLLSAVFSLSLFLFNSLPWAFFHLPIFNSCKYCWHPAESPPDRDLLFPLHPGPSLGSRGAQFSLNSSEQTLAVLRAGSDHNKGRCHHSITEIKSNWEKWVDSFTWYLVWLISKEKKYMSSCFIGK